MAFQICNVVHPNAPTNTCAFCVFEAPDTYTNLHIALDRYRDQIDELESHTWGKLIKTDHKHSGLAVSLKTGARE